MAVAWTQSLAWELPNASGTAIEKKNVFFSRNVIFPLIEQSLYIKLDCNWSWYRDFKKEFQTFLSFMYFNQETHESTLTPERKEDAKILIYP